jgi:predicted TIM-barrel fold metal-dependent hydrolase
MKIGDKVRFTNCGSYSAPTGSTARIVGIKSPYIQVEWIDKGDSGQMDGCYFPEDFEVIEEAQNNNMNKKLFTAEEMIEFELFTAEQMIEFANCFSYASEKELNSYKDILKQRQEKEYQLYLTLKAKYE